MSQGPRRAQIRVTSAAGVDVRPCGQTCPDDPGSPVDVIRLGLRVYSWFVRVLLSLRRLLSNVRLS
jgi:hypothetical protein